MAILSDGALRCCGTPLFLKERFGGGYTLTVTRPHPGAPLAGTRALVDSALASGGGGDDDHRAAVLRAAGGELAFQLPLAARARFPAVLEALERSRAEGAVGSFGITMASLEEVFLRLAGEAPATLDAAAFAAEEGARGDGEDWESTPATPLAHLAAGPSSGAVSVSGVSVSARGMPLGRHNSGELPVSFGGDAGGLRGSPARAERLSDDEPGAPPAGAGIALACLPGRRNNKAGHEAEDDAQSVGDGSHRSHSSRTLLAPATGGARNSGGGRGRSRVSPLAACLPGSRQDLADASPLPGIPEDGAPDPEPDREAGVARAAAHRGASKPGRSFRRSYVEMLRKRYLIQRRDVKGVLTNVLLPALIVGLVMLVLFLDIDPQGPELALRARTLAQPNASVVREGGRGQEARFTEVPFSDEPRAIPPGLLQAFTEDATLIPVAGAPTGYALSKELLRMNPAPWRVAHLIWAPLARCLLSHGCPQTQPVLTRLRRFHRRRRYGAFSFNDRDLPILGPAACLRVRHSLRRPSASPTARATLLTSPPAPSLPRPPGRQRLFAPGALGR